ncbi:MAG: 5-formyltetrahydrofolate cyclo-ligase [Verrucomicrobiae bacterium]
MRNAEKDSLRKKILAGAQIRTDPLALSAGVATRLRGWTVWQSASRLGAFCALSDEPDVLNPWPEGKRVALPRVEGDGFSLHWVTCREELVPGRFGILEPRQTAPPAGISFDLILVPGMAFDREGRRLGRGRGYYDRFLASATGLVAGVCFDDQLAPAVPHEPHDARMDAVITPSEIVLCARRNIR